MDKRFEYKRYAICERGEYNKKCSTITPDVIYRIPKEISGFSDVDIITEDGKAFPGIAVVTSEMIAMQIALNDPTLITPQTGGIAEAFNNIGMLKTKIDPTRYCLVEITDDGVASNVLEITPYRNPEKEYHVWVEPKKIK